MSPNVVHLYGFGFTDVTKPHKLLGFGVHGCHQTLQILKVLGPWLSPILINSYGFAAIDVIKPYKITTCRCRGYHQTVKIYRGTVFAPGKQERERERTAGEGFLLVVIA